MKLSRKIFLYSGILLSLFMVAWISYMFIMLPSLYRAQVLEQRQEGMKSFLLHHEKTGDCQKIGSGNMYESLYIPKTGNKLYLCGTYGKQTLTIKSEKLQQAIAKIQNVNKFDKVNDALTEALKSDIFQEISDKTLLHNEYFNLELHEGISENSIVNSGTNDVKVIDEHTVIRTVVGKSGNGEYYSNIFGLSLSDLGLYIALAPSTFSDTVTLFPTILQSTPMFIVMFLLLLFVSTAMFTRRIARPIEILAKRADDLKKGNDSKPLVYKGNDAIRELSLSMDNMYHEIDKNYTIVKMKNEQLQVEKARQRAFLLATSHELKTPVATSRLLVDSMIDQVGKYKDTNTYLPEVQSELKRIQQTVSKLLEVYETVTETEEEVDVKILIEDVCQKYQHLMDQKKIKVFYDATDNIIIHTSRQLIQTLVDNMISNAVKYADENSTVRLQITSQSVKVFNTCPPIPDEILHSLGDNKVSAQENDSHGLGVYLMYQYCRILGMDIKVKNTESGVIQTLAFKRNEGE